MASIRSVIFVTVLCVACVTERDRPSGPEIEVPPTSVSVVDPADDRVVGADSLVSLTIQATGLIQAVAYEANWMSRSDTTARERRELGSPQMEVRVSFEFRVPAIPNGTNVEVRGVAEDTRGELHRSEPVFLQVIDCDQFPLVCDDGF